MMASPRGTLLSFMVSIASWVLLASCCIEFCLCLAPPATSAPSSPPAPPAASRPRPHPQALPWSASRHSQPVVSLPPAFNLRASPPPSPHPMFSQSSSSKPTVSQSVISQFTVSQLTSEQSLVSQSTSAPDLVSQSTSSQYTVSQSTNSQYLVSVSASPQSLLSQLTSSQDLVSQSNSHQPTVSQPSPHPPAPQSASPQPRRSLPLAGTSPPPSHLPQPSKQLYLHLQPNFFFTSSPKSLIGGGREEIGDGEKDTGTGNGGESNGGGEGEEEEEEGDWQTITGLQITSTTQPAAGPSPSTQSGMWSTDGARPIGEGKEAEGGGQESGREGGDEVGARRTEKSNRKLHAISSKGDKLSQSGGFTPAHPFSPTGESWPHAEGRTEHPQASTSGNPAVRGRRIGGKVRYSPPLLARGALDLTSGEQEQPVKQPPPARPPDTGSTLHGAAGGPAGLLNVNEMMVNSLRSLEQEYTTSEETRLFEGKSVSGKWDKQAVEEEEEEEEEGEGEEEGSLEEDNTSEPYSKFQILASRMKPEQLSHAHDLEVEKERQLIREALAVRDSLQGSSRGRPDPPLSTGPSRDLPLASSPWSLLHFPPTPTSTPQRIDTLPEVSLPPPLQSVTSESQPRPAPPRPRSSSQPSPQHTTSIHNKEDPPKWKKTSRDQETLKEDPQKSPLVSTRQPGNESVVVSREDSATNTTNTAAMSDEGPGTPHHSALSKAASGVSSDAQDAPRSPREFMTQGSLYSPKMRRRGSERWGSRSLPAPPLNGSTSSHKWPVEKTSESESSGQRHLSLPPTHGKAQLTQHEERYTLPLAPPVPPRELRRGGGAPSASLAPSGEDITRGGKKRGKIIAPVERPEKNMVEGTPARKNGGGNLRPVIQRIKGGEKGRGRDREERRGASKITKDVAQDTDPSRGETNDDNNETTSQGVNFAEPGGVTRGSQPRRKRLFRRDAETTAQVSEGGRGAGEQEGHESQGQTRRKMRPPLAPRDAFQEHPHAAVEARLAAAHERATAPQPQFKTGIVDEVNKGPRPAAPRGMAAVAGPGDPPSRHHISQGAANTVGADYSYFPPGFATVDTSEGCQCWQTHDDSLTPEEECRCQGEHIVQLPRNLSTTMDRLSLNKMGLRSLGHRNLSIYSASIKDLILQDVNQLSSLEADVFRNMPQLRTIYISHAPRLVELPPDVFHVFLPSLKVLRIVHTGLTVLPGISQLLLNQGILHLLDLENNKIKRITTAAVSIRAIQLLLNNNSLQTVEASAFKGSEIDKLSMKGNLELTNLHPLAFQGIKSLTTLDLSSTAITRLPTEGLGGLETLILTGTHDLKIFPSVYSFQHITTAHLTYPYHCCAFKYPRLHDPAEHRKHEEFLRKMEKEFCVDVTSPTPKNSHVGAGWRRRRRGASSGSPASPVPSPDAEDQQEKQVISALSDPSPALSPAQYFSNTEVIAQRIPAVVTSSFGPSSSSPRPSSPRPALESRHRTPPVNQSPSSGGEVGRMQGRKTQVIMGETKEKDEEVVREGVKRKGEKQVIIMEDTNKEEEEEEEERLVKEGVKMEAPRVSAHSQVNKNHFHLGSGKLAHQVRGGAALSARLPRSFRHHNTSLPLPPMAPPGGADGWGVSVPQAESAARLNEPSGVLQSPSLHPENPEDDPDEDPLAYNPYHPGGFSAGVPGGFEDHGAHGLVPSGGFGEVVAPQEKPQEVPDTNQFFHRNEVTVSPVTTVCGGNLSKNYRDVQCFPKPDAFNPCEDIMGNLGLRLAVWVVVVTAVFGNLSVMIVLMSTRFKMTVSKFLMCNLAVADLCMGLYLLLIAAMDLHTIGVYFNSAIYWQNGPGCKVAGFLTVFASELSILTLTVITLERWYAITYAIHLNKRLRLSVAARVMVLAWLYALTMAGLPLIGVSGYSKTSICLPMETSDTADQVYLLVLLVTNGLAFVLICVCYAKMYCSIAGNNLAANTSDTTVAKRMALLVFTDFACWAPIAFFGLTAVCGYPLISVTHAKFLLVFFYPLNSCANPYLYAILTKQYRRDLFLMLARHGFFTRRAMKYKGGCSTNTWPNQHHVCVSGGPGGGGSGGPSRRISTLTQITTCGEWRGRARDGSVESLPRQASPPRIKSISAELAVPLAVPQGGSDRRPSDVCRKLQPVAEVHDGRASPQPAATSGSPHPIKNCYARMSFTPEQEALLQRYASDRQSGAVASNARRRPSSTDSRDDPLPLSLYTPTTPDTITTPISPSLDHAV